jgi:hypothetical protein
VARIDALGGGGEEILEHGGLDAGTDFRVSDTVDPS